MDSGTLTHLDAHGTATMIDVGDKQITTRRATAEARVRMTPATARLVAQGDAPKGDVIAIARIAAIQAAKRTDALIPLAHPLPLDHIGVDIDIDAEAGIITILCHTRTSGRTGVEMEAMIGCSVGALTIYDMVKGVERGVSVEHVQLVEKTGGAHDWHRRNLSSGGA